MSPTSTLRALVASALLCAGAAGADPPPCPPETATCLGAGWKALRTDSLLAALGLFERAGRLCPSDIGAKVGLGTTHLKLGYLMRAESLFTAVTSADPANSDGWDGLMTSAYRLGDYSVAVRAARRAWEIHRNPDARDILDRLYPGWDTPSRPRARRPDTLVVPVRARNERFEIHGTRGWWPLFVKGVELAPVLPGQPPGAFADDSAGYAGWLDGIADLNANAVRVATLLPPSFYRALGAWNAAHPERALWLIQGLEAPSPPAGDFADPHWTAVLRSDAREVLDAVHGEGEVVAQRGHAGGRYDADVSPWTLAYVLGFPWNPGLVAAFDARDPGRHTYRGRYFSMADGPALDAWLAARVDDLAGYEIERWNTLRPMAYRMSAALASLRRPLGAAASRGALDPALIQPTPLNPAGWFASCRVFPFDPEPGAREPAARARSSEGRSVWFGYLRDLRRREAWLPVLVDGYGVPSSRGAGRVQPQGWDEGGHDEAEMAAIDARLTREIRESGCAGGVLFEWMDAWWRQGPAAADLEIPPERAPVWHDAMDPDQHYGVIANDPGPGGAGPELGGVASVWRKLPAILQAPRPAKRRSWSAAGWPPERGTPITLAAGADPGYVNLAVTLAGADGRPFRWDSLGVILALDTYRPELGQRVLPGGLVRSEIGFEFIVALEGPGRAELLVTPEYNPYLGPRDLADRPSGTAPGLGLSLLGGSARGPQSSAGSATDLAGGRRMRFPVITLSSDDGYFDSLLTPAGDDRGPARAGSGSSAGAPPVAWTDLGRLRYGSQQRSSLSDWYYDPYAGLIEIRLPWSLLNVTDPSSRSVLFREQEGLEYSFQATDGFRIGVLAYRKGGAPRVLGALPALAPGGVWRAADFATWTWPKWEQPAFHSRPKPVYDAMRAVWGSMPDQLSTQGGTRRGE